MTILITGATGQLGRYAINYVKQFAPEAKIFGLVRNESQAQALKEQGVEPRFGDFSDKTSLVNAFQGIDRLLFISVPIPELQANVVAAAKEAGVSYIAYTSINAIEYGKFGLELNHRQTEQLIRESGIAHTFLRNSWYLEINQANIQAAAKTGKFYYTGNGKISHATRQELAQAAARVITGEGYPEVLELGRDAYTFRDLALATQEALGRDLEIKEVSRDEVVALLAQAGASEFEQGFPVDMMSYAAAGNNGEDQITANDFERVLGHPLPALSEAIQSILE